MSDLDEGSGGESDAENVLFRNRADDIDEQHDIQILNMGITPMLLTTDAKFDLLSGLADDNQLNNLILTHYRHQDSYPDPYCPCLMRKICFELDDVHVRQTIRFCQKDMQQRDEESRHEHLRSLISSRCFSTLLNYSLIIVLEAFMTQKEGKKVEYDYTIGSHPAKVFNGVCAYVFCKAYGISRYYLQRIQKELRTVRLFSRNFDSSNICL